MTSVRIGTAGWAIPRAVAQAFPAEGSVLQRYASRFDAAEINTTFYRQHRPQTLDRWRVSVPPDFRFAVKLPRAITHEARLQDCAEALARFLSDVAQLGDKLGPLLIQLPPSLTFDATAAAAFFADLRALYEGPAVLEPRHTTWFEADPEVLLRDHRIARVAADPARHPLAGLPGGWEGLAYWRLHGSPRMYFSPYGEEALRALSAALRSAPATETWCIFDNTASGAAAADALALRSLIEG